MARQKICDDSLVVTCRMDAAIARAFDNYARTAGLGSRSEVFRRAIAAGIAQLQIPVEKQLKDLRHG